MGTRTQQPATLSAAPARQAQRPHFVMPPDPLPLLAALPRPFNAWEVARLMDWEVGMAQVWLRIAYRKGVITDTPYGTKAFPRYSVPKPAVAVAPIRALIVRPTVALQPVALTTYMQSPFAALWDTFLCRPFVCAEVISPCPF